MSMFVRFRRRKGYKMGWVGVRECAGKLWICSFKSNSCVIMYLLVGMCRNALDLFF